MDNQRLRVFAVDWSGRKKYASKHIWLAEATGGQIVCLESGRSREELICHLIKMGRADPNLVVGLDFAFSMPEWYVKHCCAETAGEFWHVVACDGENWLANCDWPFWGRPGKPRHTDCEPLRQTEKTVLAKFGARAFSTFQIGGAGAVGTGSLRGMPFLQELANAGWSIWPFTATGFPMAVEIYPRLLTGAIRKSCKACRELYLNERYPDLTREMFIRAASTEDAFDAAVSALVMVKHWRTLAEQPRAVDAIEAIEGRIWNAPSAAWVSKHRCPRHRDRTAPHNASPARASSYRIRYSAFSKGNWWLTGSPSGIARCASR